MKIPFIESFHLNKQKTLAFMASALEKIGCGSLLVALFPSNVGIGVALYAFCLGTICLGVEFLLVNKE